MPHDRAADPWAIMRADELAASAAERGARGAWYTPRAVAEAVTALAFPPKDRAVPSFVVDPTCGGGAFLVAVLDVFVDRGVSPTEALGRIAGLDIDAGAVDTARRALQAWADHHGAQVRPGCIHRGDALAEWPDHWPTPDLIVGNPPFASPLRSSVGPAGLPANAEAFRLRHRSELGPYADLAAIHLLNAAHRLDANAGRLAFVVPQSLIAGRDAAPLREWLAAHLPVDRIWITDDRVFDANVRVCAPILDRQARRVGGVQSWAEEAADAAGIPDPGVPAGADSLGSIADATAGFRDEYYALSQACVDGDVGDERCRLATVGSIDPLVSYWGTRQTRLAKRRWDRPVVDEDKLPGAMKPWFERQRVPKVLVPTQARILEPFVDRTGRWIPVTPLLSITTGPAHLDRVAALLLAPSVVAWAARRSFGAALAPGAIKLRAKDLLDAPLPADHAAWDDAAAMVAEGPEAVDRIAGRMQEAFDADPAVMRWWRVRRAGGRSRGPTAGIG